MKKNIYLFLASILVISLSSCEESTTKAMDTSFVSFTSKTIDIGVLADSETSKEIEVYSTNITSSDRVIPVMVLEEGTNANAGAYNVPSTVTIPGGSNVGILKVDITDVDLELSVDKFLAIRLQATENTMAGETLTIGLSESCAGDLVKLKVQLEFDGWPEEAAWVVRDANGDAVLASADPLAFGAYAGMANGAAADAVCLPSGEYYIKIYDQYGDGGTDYNVTANGVQVFSATGNYGGSKDAYFTL